MVLMVYYAVTLDFLVNVHCVAFQMEYFCVMGSVCNRPNWADASTLFYLGFKTGLVC